MKLWPVAFLPLLFGCTQQIDKETSYFWDVTEGEVNGIRIVEIEVAPSDSTVDKIKEPGGVDLVCWDPEGNELPNWGIDFLQSGEFEEPPGLLGQIADKLLGQHPRDLLLREFVIVRFWPPEPWLLADDNLYQKHYEADMFELGRLAVESGMYDNCLCRYTIYWIGESRWIEEINNWDRTEWYELEYIEF